MSRGSVDELRLAKLAVLGMTAPVVLLASARLGKMFIAESTKRVASCNAILARPGKLVESIKGRVASWYSFAQARPSESRTESDRPSTGMLDQREAETRDSLTDEGG